MLSTKLYAIHGFLGLPSDWNAIFPHVHAPNLWEKPSTSLRRWAQEFNGSVSEQKSPRVVIGYSLGGRLALHCLLEPHSPWDAAVIISAHPGIECEELRKARLKDDEAWAQRFEQEPWPQLMAAWNDRSVFQKGTFHFNRAEADFDRKRLAQTLRNYSLGAQPSLLAPINSLNLPILWVVGANDSAYTKHTEKLQLKHPASKILVMPECGHRVPWEKTKDFQNYINLFIERSLQCKH